MESFRKTGRAGPLGGCGTLDTTSGVRQRLHSETSRTTLQRQGAESVRNVSANNLWVTLNEELGDDMNGSAS